MTLMEIICLLVAGAIVALGIVAFCTEDVDADLKEEMAEKIRRGED
jgi:hypothetical protein